MRLCLVAAALVLSACGQTPAEKVNAPVTLEPQPAAAAGWSAQLSEMMPFIDACIAKSPTTRTITHAGRTGEGLVTVRLSGASGAVDCSVADDDPAQAAITPRREDWVIEGESEAIFVRGPGEDPGGECYAAPEVRDANGGLLGWMLDPEGC